jgi:transposase
LGEPGSTAAVVAPASHGAGTHPDHESIAGGSTERRPALQEEVGGERGREQLESFRLAPWASRRRHDLLELLDRLNPTITELNRAIDQEVERCPEAQQLMTHPGVGPLTALGFVLIIGRPERFQCGKQIASYLGLIPLEDSSGNRRRLGHITKQGSSMLRFCW